MSYKGRLGNTEGEFSVTQFFDAKAPLQEGLHETVRAYVNAKEATDAFFHYTQSVAAKMGWTQRVIITDGGDEVNMEWTFKDGITFPTEHAGKLKPTGTESGRWDSKNAPETQEPKTSAISSDSTGESTK